VKLYAISDLHLANKLNRKALLNLPKHTDDWLILGGDIGETSEHLKFALFVLTQKFKQIIWVPGNHDLWAFPLSEYELKGESKYNYLVSVCRQFGVYTPEDDFPEIIIRNQTFIIAPTFTLYDYSFRPENIPYEKAIEWAEESGIICTDEDLLVTTPYSSIAEWCNMRCDYTEARLSQLSPDFPIILVNHYPILMEHSQLWHFPRFALWCGTKRTGEWLRRYNIKIAIYGHTHIRSSKYENGIRFEEVSLGYPRDWDEDKGLEFYLREIVAG
jgi:predicted phosphodiesterase